MSDIKKFLSRVFNNEYFNLTISLLICSCFYNLFLRPLHIVTGGVNGIVILLEEYIPLDNSILQFLINLIFLLIGMFFISKKQTLALLYLTFVYPMMVYATSFLSEILNVSPEMMFMVAVFAGIGIGISNGLLYKSGFTTGGLGVVAFIIAKKFKSSITWLNAILNLTIVALGAFQFGITSCLYAVIVIFVSKIISDKLFLGVSNNKVFYIISSKHEEILKFLINELNHDATIYDAYGKYTDANLKMIMTVIPTREYFIFKEYIMDIDSKAFVFVSDNYEVQSQDILVNSK